MKLTGYGKQNLPGGLYWVATIRRGWFWSLFLGSKEWEVVSEYGIVWHYRETGEEVDIFTSAMLKREIRDPIEKRKRLKAFNG